jgi:protein-S-isoprenylcysteine O-methyltransferase Ste14
MIRRMLIFILAAPLPLLLVLPVLLGRSTNQRPVRWAGKAAALVAWSTGLSWVIWVIQAFLKTGKGTPAPNAPTQRMVNHGLFRFSRNPMYIGAFLIAAGHALWFQAKRLWVYTLGLALFFHIVVITYEEPQLIAQFGADYHQYTAQVARWLPGFRSIRTSLEGLDR